MRDEALPRITYLNRGTRDWHRKPPRNEAHPQIKITVVKSGRGAIETRTHCDLLHAGMAVVTPPYLFHSFGGPDVPVEVLIASFTNLGEPWYSRLFPHEAPQFFTLSEEALQAVDFLHAGCEAERARGDTLSHTAAPTLLLGILAILLRSRAGAQPRDAALRLKSLRESIASRLHETVKVGDLARQLGISESAFRQKYQREFGCSPKDEIDRLRLQHAQNLLLKSDLKLHAIALACGFADVPSFSKFFRRHMGVSPAHWRALPFEAKWRPRVSDKKRGGSDK